MTIDDQEQQRRMIMPNYETIDFTEEELEELREVLEEARTEYGYEKVMPQTEAVLKQFPGINPMGHYSEIDMGITDRLKRCEYASRMRDPLAWEVYQDVKQKIEQTHEYKAMKLKMLELSKKVNVIDHAIRLSSSDRVVEYLEAQKEELKNDPALKDYDKFLEAMEYYSGVKFLDPSVQHKEQFEIADFLQEKFGVKSKNSINYGIHDQVLNFSNPKSIEIEFENFDHMVTFQRMLDDKNLGKQLEEIEAESMDPSDIKRYVSTIPAYVEASCDRALAAALPNAKDRADMLFINGRSIREMMQDEKEFKDKEPTEEQIKKYSNLYVASALRNGSYVEAFTKSQKDNGSINYKPVPITAKGEDSYILKKGGAKEVEKITISFLDRFLAKLGFTHFKEKIKAAELADRVKDSREAFRAAHASEMKKPMTRQEMEDKKQTFKAIHKYKDNFLKLHEQNMNYNNMNVTLDNQFFPEGKKSIVNKATGIKRSDEREYLRTLVVAHMLKEGYTLEQVMDTSNYIEERAQCAESLREKLEACGEKEFFETMFDYQKVLKDSIEEYAERHNISFKDPDSVWGDPSAYLMDLALGLGNMTDFMLGSDLKKKVEGYFGKEAVEAADKLSRNCLVIGMLPKNVGKCEQIYRKLAEGKTSKDPQTDMFSDAIKAEVVTAVIGAFEKPGEIFSPDTDLIQVEYIHQMVMTHPNTKKYFENASNEKLMDVIAKRNVLKELKVDFEILNEKKVPGKNLASEVFDVNIELGDPVAAVNVVPTFDGSSAYYEMDTLDNVMEKMEEMENSAEM